MVTAASVVAGPAASSSAASQAYRPAIASVQPAGDVAVGVAHPVVVTFTTPVTNRLAAERTLNIRSTPAMTGK
jgi:lipoprotein-anchoring transpeptidase ErfK/SrfK